MDTFVRECVLLNLRECYFTFQYISIRKFFALDWCVVKRWQPLAWLVLIGHRQRPADSEDSAVLSSQLLLGTALIVANAVFHVSCLVWLASLINHIGTSPNFDADRKALILLLAIAVLELIAIHTASAWAWAVVYLVVGEFTELSRALYFSVVTSTTLGYGDITLSERWQLLASFQAMGGLILFGASTAFLLAVTKSWFSHLEEPAE